MEKEEETVNYNSFPAFPGYIFGMHYGFSRWILWLSSLVEFSYRIFLLDSLFDSLMSLIGFCS